MRGGVAAIVGVSLARPIWSEGKAGWGAWETALRWEAFRLRHGADGPDADPVENRYNAFAAGLNWYPNEVLRFSLNYVYGLYADAGGGESPNPNKHANNAVLSRIQLEF